MIHGFTGAPSSFAALCERLPPQLEVWAPTSCGHSGPTPPQVRCTARQFGERSAAPLGGDSLPVDCAGSFVGEVDRVAAWLSGNGFENGVLLGYSLGARLALGLLVRHPQLFARATLIGVHPGLQDGAARQQREASDERWCSLLQREGLDAFASQWQAQPLFDSQRSLDPKLLEAQRRVRLGHSADGLSQSLRCCGLAAMPDWSAELVAIEQPVRLGVGQLDAKFRALARRMAAALPDVTLHEEPGAGHNVLLERPAAVAAWLLSDLGS